MAFQFSTAVRNGRVNSIATIIAASAKLEIFTGAQPANCAAATTGTKLVEYDLASSWLGAASGGAANLLNLPLTVTGAATGTAGYFRLFATDGVTCGAQGLCSAGGGGGDMIFDNTSIATGQTVNIVGFTITDGNA